MNQVLLIWAYNRRALLDDHLFPEAHDGTRTESTRDGLVSANRLSLTTDQTPFESAKSTEIVLVSRRFRNFSAWDMPAHRAVLFFRRL